ncbi:hypothetical protein QJS10_CPB22g00260 [Acorus calamus]|uniref:Transmembrane protein n=1 Tax=Acorus calamus TaxID=4465 RepID=A0AAV9BZK9_ACOCL|nr:hypothetical protein QJS10_CPB22g00260 [Acorus calamus]
MHRTSSASRIATDAPHEQQHQQQQRTAEINYHQVLPTFHPSSAAARREASRVRAAESAIHVIPAVLVACAVILWFFSHPHVDLVREGGSVIRVAGIRTADSMIDGEDRNFSVADQDSGIAFGSFGGSERSD